MLIVEDNNNHVSMMLDVLRYSAEKTMVAAKRMLMTIVYKYFTV